MCRVLVVTLGFKNMGIIGKKIKKLLKKYKFFKLDIFLTHV
jgi:hypothetical protein